MLDTKEINSIKNKLLEEDTIIDIAELFIELDAKQKQYKCK